MFIGARLPPFRYPAGTSEPQLLFFFLSKTASMRLFSFRQTCYKSTSQGFHDAFTRFDNFPRWLVNNSETVVIFLFTRPLWWMLPRTEIAEEECRQKGWKAGASAPAGWDCTSLSACGCIFLFTDLRTHQISLLNCHSHTLLLRLLSILCRSSQPGGHDPFGG